MQKNKKNTVENNDKLHRRAKRAEGVRLQLIELFTKVVYGFFYMNSNKYILYIYIVKLKKIYVL